MKKERENIHALIGINKVVETTISGTNLIKIE